MNFHTHSDDPVAFFFEQDVVTGLFHPVKLTCQDVFRNVLKRENKRKKQWEVVNSGGGGSTIHDSFLEQETKSII